MVILQFNKLIRNKWVWGAFAVIVSAAFCFDDLFRSKGSDDVKREKVGTMNGEAMDAEMFETLRRDALGYGDAAMRRSSRSEAEAKAVEAYAAKMVADANGVSIDDEVVKDVIKRNIANGQSFDFANYSRFIEGQFGITVDQFENWQRRNIAIYQTVGYDLVSAAAWASPMEVDQAVYDMTDRYTVKVATFTQSAEDAAAVTVDDAGLRKWYDENKETIELPNLVKIRYVKFDAADTNLLAKMAVTEDDVLKYYNDHPSKYTTKGTNDEDIVTAFEDVKDQIDRQLRIAAAVECIETNLYTRAAAELSEADKDKSRLDLIAAEDGLKVYESGWFATAKGAPVVEGFMLRATSVLPGAQNFLETVAPLNPKSESTRYAVVSSPNAVWLVERGDARKKGIPSFEEAKDKIGDRALRDAKAAAFKAKVEAVIAKGYDAVVASGDVSTNITFCVSEYAADAFENQRLVMGAALKLKQGGVSEFTPIGAGKAIVVACEKREPGDIATAAIMRPRVVRDVSARALPDIVKAWPKWNLKRMNFVPANARKAKADKAAKE